MASRLGVPTILSGLFCLFVWVWASAFLGGSREAVGWTEGPSSQTVVSSQGADGQKAIAYSLFLDPGWEKSPKEKPLVISIPGMGSTGTPIDKVLELARKEGFPSARFVFPHEPIQQTAYRLAQALRDIRGKAPERRVALVSYSLGGLIARAVIEDPELDSGNVWALIMLCPPNHGSLLVQLLPWKDAGQNTESSKSAGHPQNFLPKPFSEAETTRTGMTAVLADLRPGSAFLTRLNARPRNPKVHYTILLGDRAYLGSQERESLSKWALPLPRPSNPPGKEPFGALVSQLDELVHGRGDGAVAIARGKLEGVQDVHIFHFSHVGLLRTEWNSPEVQRAQQVILDRLRTCPP